MRIWKASKPFGSTIIDTSIFDWKTKKPSWRKAILVIFIKFIAGHCPLEGLTFGEIYPHPQCIHLESPKPRYSGGLVSMRGG